RALPRALECSADEVAEERRRPGRPRLELRMELAGDEPGMVGELDDLDESSGLEGPGHDETCVNECRPVVVVDLVAMTVSFVDDRLAVGVMCARFLDNLDRLGTESHRPPQV